MSKNNTPFLKYLQGIDNPNQISVRKAALNYLKVAHPNKNRKQNSQTVKNTRNAISVKDMQNITVEQFLRTNLDKIGVLESSIRRINTISKDMVKHADNLVRNKDLLLVLMYCVMIQNRISNYVPSMRGGSDQRNLIILSKVKNALNELPDNTQPLSKSEIKTLFYNATAQSRLGKDTKFQREIIAKILGEEESVTIFTLMSKIDDEMNQINKETKEKVNEMVTEITPEKVENVKKVVKSGFNIHAIVALFTMFVTVLSLLLHSQQHKAHSLFNTTNDILSAIESRNVSEITQGCIKLKDEMIDMNIEARQLNSVCYAFIHDEDVSAKQELINAARKFEESFYFTTSPLSIEPDLSVENLDGDTTDVIIANLTDSGYEDTAKELTKLYDDLIVTNTSLHTFSSVVNATGLFMESEGERDTLSDLIEVVEQQKLKYSNRAEIVSEQEMLSSEESEYHKVFTLPQTTTLNTIESYVTKRQSEITGLVQKPIELEGNLYSEKRSGLRTKKVEFSQELDLLRKTMTDLALKRHEMLEESKVSAAKSSFENKRQASQSIMVMEILETAFQRFVMEKDLMNKANRQDKGINEIVSFDEFRINIESNLKFVYHAFITSHLEQLNSLVPDDITKQYFVREDLTHEESIAEIQKIVESFTSMTDIVSSKIIEYNVVLKDFEDIYRSLIFSKNTGMIPLDMFYDGSIKWDSLSNDFEREIEVLYNSLDKSLSSPEHFKQKLYDHFKFSVETPPVFHHLYKTVTDPVGTAKETAIGTMSTLGEGAGITMHELMLNTFNIDTYTTIGRVTSLFYIALFITFMRALSLSSIVYLAKGIASLPSSIARLLTQTKTTPSVDLIELQIRRNMDDIPRLKDISRHIPRIASYIERNNIDVEAFLQRIRNMPLMIGSQDQYRSQQSQRETRENALVTEFLSHLNDSDEAFTAWMNQQGGGRRVTKSVGKNKKMTKKHAKKHRRKQALMRKSIRKITQSTKKRSPVMKRNPKHMTKKK